MKIIFTIVVLFSSLLVSAQTQRDTLVSNIYNAFIQNDSDYTALKNDITELKKTDGKYNPEILNQNLEAMFKYKDISFFKEALELLILHYGYNVSYLSGNENYYQSIISGDLSKWFKKMYIKNHPKWLEKNLDKLVDIQTLNTLNKNDQLMTKTLMDVHNSSKIDEKQQEFILNLFKLNVFENAKTLINISKSIGSIPTGNSFALIQKPYDIVEIHNFQQNFTTFFDMIYPYYKVAYLNKDLPIIKFRNIDSLKFLADKNQIFGLLSIEDIPEYLKKDFNLQSIESADINLTKQYRKELKWF